MKKLLLAVAVTTTLLFVGCNSGGGDPKAVLMAFFEAMSKKDIAAAKKLATKDSEQMFSLMEMGMNMGKDKADNEMGNFDKSKMEFGEPKIEGDKATIQVKDKAKGESLNFLLKKESGAWKVAFDKSWFTQMAAEKMSEKGINSAAMDTLNNSLDKLKDINTDSLAKQMQEGLDKINENKEKIEDATKKIKDAAEKMKQQ